MSDSLVPPAEQGRDGHPLKESVRYGGRHSCGLPSESPRTWQEQAARARCTKPDTLEKRIQETPGFIADVLDFMPPSVAWRWREKILNALEPQEPGALSPQLILLEQKEGAEQDAASLAYSLDPSEQNRLKLVRETREALAVGDQLLRAALEA